MEFARVTFRLGVSPKNANAGASRGCQQIEISQGRLLRIVYVLLTVRGEMSVQV